MQHFRMQHSDKSVACNTNPLYGRNAKYHEKEFVGAWGSREYGGKQNGTAGKPPDMRTKIRGFPDGWLIPSASGKWCSG